jgi:hypothetical protein
MLSSLDEGGRVQIRSPEISRRRRFAAQARTALRLAYGWDMIIAWNLLQQRKHPYLQPRLQFLQTG